MLFLSILRLTLKNLMAIDNKSPGPDGYTFEFFKKYWDFIGSDFSEAVEFFFINRSFSRGCNSSFVALIPKVVDAKFVNDFWPISLIGCVYKVVTKILANRLSSVIADLLSDTRYAFISGRQILDGPFILDEILNWCKRKNKQAMFFKVDFAKAYDSVRWDYLLDVLEGFGFWSTWCNWIRGVKVEGFMSRHKAWEDIIHKIRSRLSKWKVPRGVLKALEAMHNRFFIGSDESDRKITWVAWEKVLASKENGDKMHFPLYHSFRRIARDGLEHHQMTDLQSMLDLMSLSQSRDRWFCDLTGDGEFQVKEVRNSIDDIFLPSNVKPTRWVKHIPIKVNIFAWRARRDCLPTRSIWRRICRWWDLVPQLWLSFLDWQDWFDSIRLTSKVKALLEGVLYTTWWVIWMFRNHSISEESPPNHSAIFNDIVSFTFNWCHSRCNRLFSWDNWLQNPHLISL
nr:RNA-directed DNA polymerase, eukaryota [Tanacetum cinerariifolium]